MGARASYSSQLTVSNATPYGCMLAACTALAAACGSSGTPTDASALPDGIIRDAPVKVDAPAAGPSTFTWQTKLNNRDATCAQLLPTPSEIKFSFFVGDVNMQTKRVPCSDGRVQVNVPPGSYRVVASVAPAGDPTKSGLEHVSQMADITLAGVQVDLTVAQADATLTWLPAQLPSCTTSGAKLTIKIDKTTVVDVACSSASATTRLPIIPKAATIIVGPTGQQTIYNKSITVPAAGGTVALPIP